MGNHGKKFRNASAKVDRSKRYPIDEACKLVPETKVAKFDESVDIAVRLGVDPKHADQIVRGAIVLPHGIGKDTRVLVFAKGAKESEAKAAGADFVGGAELVEKVNGGWTEFDVAVAVPAMMRHVGKLGRVLGPQGKMPSPKAGTVTTDVATAVKEYTAGKIEFRNDAGGNIHAVVGKLSFTDHDLSANAHALIDTLRKMKPPAAKGSYIKKVTVHSSMSPGINIDTTHLDVHEEEA
jgi:large subunit ribosomal protein L1